MLIYNKITVFSFKTTPSKPYEIGKQFNGAEQTSDSALSGYKVYVPP